jgi:hypothetical protein
MDPMQSVDRSRNVFLGLFHYLAAYLGTTGSVSLRVAACVACIRI